MEALAIARKIQMSPYKIREVADRIRHQAVNKAIIMLKYHTDRHKSSKILLKVLNSAVQNAVHNHGMSGSDLVITTLLIDQGPTLKRSQPRAKGRTYPILKRSSIITVGVTQFIPKPVTKKVTKKKSHGAKSTS
jgi:large subunit ribosomal protein L22